MRGRTKWRWFLTGLAVVVLILGIAGETWMLVGALLGILWSQRNEVQT